MMFIEVDVMKEDGYAETLSVNINHIRSIEPCGAFALIDMGHKKLNINESYKDVCKMVHHEERWEHERLCDCD